MDDKEKIRKYHEMIGKYYDPKEKCIEKEGMLMLDIL